MTGWRSPERRAYQQSFTPYIPAGRPSLPDSPMPTFSETAEVPPILTPLPTATPGNLPASPRKSPGSPSSKALPSSRPGGILRRSSSAQLLAAGELVKSAAGPAIRTVTEVVGGAAGVVGWATSGLTARITHSTAPAVAKAVASGDLISVEIKLLSSRDHRIQVEVGMTVAEFREHVRLATGLTPQQQVIVIAEDRARLQGIAKLAKRMTTHINSTRQDLRSAVISWVNFIFLPEVFNRELYGRGVISWAKGTSWYQSLQEAQNRAAVAAAASQDNSCGSAKIQVEQLNGQVLLMEVDIEASLEELKHAIQQRLGIMIEQQRLIVLERQGPGRLTNLTNMMLLHTFAGLKLAIGAAAWAGSSLLSKPEAGFPVCVRTTAGRPVSLTISGETTVNQIRAMLEENLDVQQAEDVQAISFPPQLPPLREEVPNSHVIRAVGA